MAVPSAAAGWDNGGGEPDYVVSVSIDSTPSGDNSGDPDTQLCTGFSSISVSSTALASTLESAQRGSEAPTLAQRLAPYGLTPNSVFMGAPIFYQVDTDAWEYDSDWANSNGYLVGELDNNDGGGPDGVIDYRDISLAYFDKLTYVSEPLQVSFDADSCVDSWMYGDVYVERSPVQKRVYETFENMGATWQDIEEVDEDPYGVNLAMQLIMGRPAYGYAYMRRDTQIGGQTFDRRFACEPFNDEDGYTCDGPIILSGQVGTTSLQAVTNIYGNNVEGQFRTRYGFWLYTYLD